jgi:hypothetical protein
MAKYVEPVEIHREEWGGLEDGPTPRYKCRGCGREISLYFNGGELDHRGCCGYSYSLEHVRIDFVIERATAVPDA